MVRELTFKADFGKTIDRFDAWWHGELIDRPPVTLYVPPKAVPKELSHTPASLRDRWMDVDYVVDSAIFDLEVGNYIGDTLPLFNPNLGPEITATLFGVDLEFGEHTSWSKPVVHEATGWETILRSPPNFANPYWQTLEKITESAIARSNGRYLVGITDLHGSYDILAALRDPQELCFDVADCPDVLRHVGRHAANGFVEAFRRQYAQLAAADMGSCSWTPCYFQGPAYVASCDFWCMVSDKDARELILPDILTELSPLHRSIFHLDGPGALRHLPLLLEIPHLNAIQWVYGAGHGPASKWIDIFRQILDAGKVVQILAEGPEDALTVLKSLGPEGVWLCPGYFPSVEAGQAFLRDVERLTEGV